MTKVGLLLIVSGPSGVGKTTIARHVESRFDGDFSVSTTTRPKTSGDKVGYDYRFVDEQTFEEICSTDQFLEWAEIFGNYYGTPRQPVIDALNKGKLMILEIDVKGAIQVKKKMPDAFAIFVLPPDENVLLDRLRGRKRDEESAIQRRYAEAKDEINLARTCGVYDAFVVNDKLDTALADAVNYVEKKLESICGS